MCHPPHPLSFAVHFLCIPTPFFLLFPSACLVSSLFFLCFPSACSVSSIFTSFVTFCHFLHPTHHHSILSSRHPSLYFIKHINSGVCGDKCVTVFLPRISPADWNPFSLLIQCGWSERDSLSCLCVCVRAHAHWRWISLSVCVNVFERERERGRNTWGVRVGMSVCVSHHMHLLYCIWISWLRIRVFSLIKQIGVDAMRGERRGLGMWSEARLMPVCINAVWHLSARDTHTLWCVAILWHCVSVFVLKLRSLWQSSQRINWFFFFFSYLHSHATWYTSYFICNAGCQTLRYLYLHLSLHIPSRRLCVCDLCPCNKLDAFPGCSNQLNLGFTFGFPSNSPFLQPATKLTFFPLMLF